MPLGDEGCKSVFTKTTYFEMYCLQNPLFQRYGSKLVRFNAIGHNDRGEKTFVILFEFYTSRLTIPDL
jgi:hypothetical protein